MPINRVGDTGFIATGKDSIAMVRLLALKGRLGLEAKGLRFRGASTLSIIKREFGLKARTAAAMVPIFEAYVEEQGQKYLATQAEVVP